LEVDDICSWSDSWEASECSSLPEEGERELESDLESERELSCSLLMISDYYKGRGKGENST
jgi:hypothetical protein